MVAKPKHHVYIYPNSLYYRISFASTVYNRDTPWNLNTNFQSELLLSSFSC